MRARACEAISIAWPKDAAFFVNRNLEKPRDNHAAFLAVVNEGNPSRIRARLIAFVEDLQLRFGPSSADLPIGHASLSDLEKIARAMEGASCRLGLDREKLGKPYGDCVEKPFQGSDRGVALVRFDQ